MAAIWESKKYNRINWQNRPSTATALGATNLNKIDVFCNDVDNALIQMDAGKLNIETANSMLASVSFDSETGKFTFKELDGTTYEYDLNLEKIPVSFTLTEDGILTMTTEDGTQWTCNIADLIKDYVFDDSDTIAFEKEFVEEDDEGKGSYHVTASVKAGSINETHLNTDYRSDILTYTTQAQTAANDSLTYSKDSKRWAVGDAEYEGSATDNAKYYKEQAEAAKQAAEEARDEAQAATGAVVMAPGVLGVGKPDNTTIEVALDGTISAKEATGTSPGISRPDGTTLGVEEGVMKMIADATSLLITDNQELVVEKVGDVAQKTTTQLLIDTIAQKVANELVTNSALTTTLANYVTKAMMSNVQVNDQNMVPTSALAYSMDQAITQLNSDIETIGDWKVIKQGNGLCIALARTRHSLSFLTHAGGAYYANSSFAKYLPEGLFQTVDNLFCTVTASSSGIFVASYRNNWEYSTSKTPSIILASLDNLEGVSCDVSLMVVGTWK